jgi:acetyl esterase/lipase
VVQLPGCAYLGSPHVDATDSLPSMQSNKWTDALVPPLIMSFVNKFVGAHHPNVESRRAISPLFQEKAGLPPLYVSASPDELLYDSVVQFAEECKGQGVTVELDDDKPFTTHCYQVWSALSPAAGETMDRLVAFANKHLAQ